jgi:tetratricopeptide (TPR) repeat protein
LATSYSERAQCLLALGRFLEALEYDSLAVEDIRRAAASGNSMLQEEEAVYLIERAHLYLRLGRLEEAEALIRQSKDRLGDDRRSHRDLARRVLTEIGEWRAASPQGQLDWRWTWPYRKIVRYDPFQWLSQAAFTEEEERMWMELRDGHSDIPGTERQMHIDNLIVQSRDREVALALQENREPRLRYPCIPAGEIEQKIGDLEQLAREINQGESNAIVRKLYLEVLGEHLAYLRMILATHNGQVESFIRYNEAIHGRPAAEELQQAFTYIGRLIAVGRQRAETVEVSDQVHALLRTVGAPISVPRRVAPSEVLRKSPGANSSPPRRFSPQTLKRFLDATMREYGFDGWETIIDATANVERIEQLTQRLILPDKALSLSGVRQLLKEEVEAHMFRAVAGAKSRLDLLATGTRGFMATEEGLAEYKDREWARRQGKNVEEFSAGGLFGLLSTGLAAGILTMPMTFSHLYRFLEVFLVLYRSVLLIDKDVERARAKAPDLARQRCLRTFRGVSDLNVPGAAYLKDWLYHHGRLQVEEVALRDERVLQRLMVGVVGLEQLPDMLELGIVEPPQSPRWLAYDPDLASYIQAFEIA